MQGLLKFIAAHMTNFTFIHVEKQQFCNSMKPDFVNPLAGYQYPLSNELYSISLYHQHIGVLFIASSISLMYITNKSGTKTDALFHTTQQWRRQAWGTGARVPPLEFANARKFCRHNARWLSHLDDLVTTNFGTRATRTCAPHGAKFWRRYCQSELHSILITAL